MIFTRPLLLKRLLFGRSHRNRSHRLLYDQIWKPKWRAKDLISKHVKPDVQSQVWNPLFMPTVNQIHDLVYHEIRWGPLL